MGGRGASSGNTGINTELSKVRNLLKNFDYINERDRDEIIEDIKDEIRYTKEGYEEKEITDKEVLRKKMKSRMRNFIGGKYMFQDGKYNDEIMQIAQNISRKIYK